MNSKKHFISTNRNIEQLKQGTIRNEDGWNTKESIHEELSPRVVIPIVRLQFTDVYRCSGILGLMVSKTIVPGLLSFVCHYNFLPRPVANRIPIFSQGLSLARSVCSALSTSMIFPGVYFERDFGGTSKRVLVLKSSSLS
ncbi:hypothetical protein JTE90_014588 [Oedothorax gibbosus]|uniref:Uncharacterized protein n=1 Tax=Oedothorax gibbosus TaxID=931172 RepID=A0AAV6UN47_9ARAC|nr:hypothetical protein JTE90_014588 [Oedothorax gibbosus]